VRPEATPAREPLLAEDAGEPPASPIHAFVLDGLNGFAATLPVCEVESPVPEGVVVRPCPNHIHDPFVIVPDGDGGQRISVVTLDQVRRCLGLLRPEAERVSAYFEMLRVENPKLHAADSLRRIAADIPR
jgi:hypothetical protein